jgi:hypothetical protein
VVGREALNNVRVNIFGGFGGEMIPYSTCEMKGLDAVVGVVGGEEVEKAAGVVGAIKAGGVGISG